MFTSSVDIAARARTCLALDVNMKLAVWIMLASFLDLASIGIAIVFENDRMHVCIIISTRMGISGLVVGFAFALTLRAVLM